MSQKKKPIFKTERFLPKIDRKIVRKIKNKLSARKSRLKKKNYYSELEERVYKLENEYAKRKLLNKWEHIEDLIDKIENKEKDNDISENCNNRTEYETLRNLALSEIMRKLICNVIPLEYKNDKNLAKINDICYADSIDDLVEKINHSINDFSLMGGNDLVYTEMSLYFKKLKDFIHSFQDLIRM